MVVKWTLQKDCTRNVQMQISLKKNSFGSSDRTVSPSQVFNLICTMPPTFTSSLGLWHYFARLHRIHSFYNMYSHIIQTFTVQPFLVPR